MLSAQRAALKSTIKTSKCLNCSKTRSLAVRSVTSTIRPNSFAVLAAVNEDESNQRIHHGVLISAAALSLLALGATVSTSHNNVKCDNGYLTPSQVAKDDMKNVCHDDDDDDEAKLLRLPLYTSGKSGDDSLNETFIFVHIIVPCQFVTQLVRIQHYSIPFSSS